MSLLWGVLAVGGCTGTGHDALEIWATGDCNPVGPDSPVQRQTDCFDAATGQVTLRSAINETVAFQLVLRGGASRIEGVEVAFESLAGPGGATIGAEQLRAFREWFIRVHRYPGWYLRRTGRRRRLREIADVLVPLEAPRYGQPFNLPADHNEILWIDLAVPKGTRPGRYRGRIVVRAEPEIERSVGLVVDVLPFSLPGAGHLTTQTPVSLERLFHHHLRRDGRPYVPPRISPQDPMGPRAARLAKRMFALLQSHRVAGYAPGLEPLLRVDANGQIEIDWDDYDRVVAGLLSGQAFADRVGLGVWRMPLTRRFPAPPSFGGLDSPGYARTLRTYLAACVTHFREKGWLDRAYASVPIPDGQPPQRYRVAGRYGRIARLNGPLPRLAMALPPMSMEPYGWVGHYHRPLDEWADIWSAPARFYDPAAMRAQRARGRETWFAADEPPYSGSLAIEAPPLHAVSLGWQAFRYEASGIVLTPANHWSDEPMLETIGSADQPSDAWLTYPGLPCGLDGPIPSVRLKRLRRGLQDYEYLWLLGRYGREAFARLLAESLVKFAGTDAFGDHFADGMAGGIVADREAWTLARRLAGDELARAIHGEQPEPFERFAERVQWRRFLGLTRSIKLWADPARVRLAGAEAPGERRVTFVVWIRNETLRPVSGLVRLASLPVGWTPIDSPVRVRPLAPGEQAQVELAARCPSIPVDAYGVYHQRIVLQTEDGAERSCEARVAEIGARLTTRAIKVDGKTDDWSGGVGNVAGQFVTVSDPSAEADPGAQFESAEQPTVVLVCHDGQRMYLLINCTHRRPDQIRVSQSNFVRYDRLRPAGDDLVELLFEPSNSGTGGSGALYHVVIKANGTVVTERGVSVEPPIGRHGFWAADIRARRGQRPGGYILEVSIPFEAFGANARDATFWGFNVGRLTWFNGEYSSWAGARRYLYSPRSLGNVAWVR